MFCSKCGAQNDEGSAFCINCGNEFKMDATAYVAQTSVTASGNIHSATHEWYYHLDGQSYGPFPENEIKKLITDGKLLSDTLVWSNDPRYAERGWIKISDTELVASQHTTFEQTQSESKNHDFKEFVGSHVRTTFKTFEDISLDIKNSSFIKNCGTVDNRFAWAMVGIQVAVFVAGYIHWVLPILCYSALAFLARKDVECIATFKGLEPSKKELLHGSLWGFFLSPVYLWKRATKIGDKKRLQFWACIVVSIIGVAFLFFAELSSINNTLIVDTVNEIIVDNSLGNARCVNVTRTQKLSDTYSIYKALLDNEMAFDINVTFLSNNRIFVEIPDAGILQMQGYFRK